MRQPPFFSYVYPHEERGNKARDHPFALRFPVVELPGDGLRVKTASGNLAGNVTGHPKAEVLRKRGNTFLDRLHFPA